MAKHAATAATGTEAALLDALGGDCVGVDTLVTRTGMTSAIVMAALTGLELSGQVSAIPGGLWQRLHRT